MACPYFVPREIVYDVAWPHPARLPLGAGWTGSCCAQDGQPATGSAAGAVSMELDTALIRDFCNLGYATGCPHLPSAREWDAVRFSVASITASHITLCYVCEFDHAPKAHGTLIYDLADEAWRNAPATGFGATNDARVSRLATSYLVAYRARQNGAPPDTYE